MICVACGKKAFFSFHTYWECQSCGHRYQCVNGIPKLYIEENVGTADKRLRDQLYNGLLGRFYNLVMPLLSLTAWDPQRGRRHTRACCSRSLHLRHTPTQGPATALPSSGSTARRRRYAKLPCPSRAATRPVPRTTGWLRTATWSGCSTDQRRLPSRTCSPRRGLRTHLGNT